eukprot:CAMPEP_0178450992 /NCGR_PEP_ID=MMETSP0689_2-20121128/43433_1 /TAXON_ID=160604 /ORGANISM="Amphidinium massartii, Strain CS-259" /LENGTH=195 /DNA_ID=CAMNT_0020076521 /DNA_START=310 /DNA_END=894 /DNA_ORIENTATION=+
MSCSTGAYTLSLPYSKRHIAQCANFPLRMRTVMNAADFVPFRDLHQFRAVVLFPWDPALMAFYELYALSGVALLLPAQAWMVRVHQSTGWIWSQTGGAVELAGRHLLQAAGLATQPLEKYSPWWDKEKAIPEQGYIGIRGQTWLDSRISQGSKVCQGCSDFCFNPAPCGKHAEGCKDTVAGFFSQACGGTVMPSG